MEDLELEWNDDRPFGGDGKDSLFDPKLHQAPLGPFFEEILTLGSVLGLLTPRLAKLLLSQSIENTPFLIPDHPQYVITLAGLQQESCRVSLARVSLTLMLPLGDFSIH